MIGNITRGGNFDGIGRYLYAVGKNHETHDNPRAVASDNVMRDDSRQWRPWVADMEWCAQQRPEVANPVWHCSIRAAPEDRILSDAEWGRIAREHAERMGLQDHPWVAVRHADDHVHVVASRVNGDGKLWRDSNDKLRSMESMRAIEREHGLTRVDGDRDTDRLATVTKSEREQGKRLGRDPDRAQLRDAMHEARDAARGRGPAAFERELEQREVMHRANTTKDGLRVRGYSVSRPDWRDARGEQIWVKASEVDRKLGWKRLQADLGSDRAADATAIEAARRVAQAYPTRAEVAAARSRPGVEGAEESAARQQVEAQLARIRELRRRQEQERGDRGR